MPKNYLIPCLVVLFVVGILTESHANARERRNRRKSHAPRVVSVLGPKISLLRVDGFGGWTTTAGQPPREGWSLSGGMLRLQDRKELEKRAGDIVTDLDADSFVLDFTWSIPKGGNSGIKYRVGNFPGKGWIGLEYQILGDYISGTEKRSKNSTGALYDMIPPNDRKKLKPNGEKNTGRIVVVGDRIEHWLNGEKIVDVVVGSAEWKKAISESKFAEIEGFGKNRSVRILIQDHGSEVLFHDMTFRKISGASTYRK